MVCNKKRLTKKEKEQRFWKNYQRRYSRWLDREAKKPRILWNETKKEYYWWPHEPKESKYKEPVITNWFGGCMQCRE